MTARYAIYYAPRSATELWRFGSSVLGYDAVTGRDVPFPDGEPFDSSDWSALTADPRRYGFHATLKAPFRLKDGVGEEDLRAALMGFAGRRASFTVPGLKVALLGGFVALVPDGPQPQLAVLAADCVREFDHLRRPLSAEDRDRRLQAPLSERQVRQLDDWGYPHVFEDFRFHMTLTGSLPLDAREAVRAGLAGRYAALPPGLAVDGVTLFRQDDRGARFRILERLSFAQ